MAKLKITKNHQLIQEMALDQQQTYLAGRGQSCQIKMDPEPGISRQHFQMLYKEEGWQLEVLSKYGELYINKEKSPQTFLLKEGVTFQVPPYEFTFGEGSIQKEIEGTQNNIPEEVDPADKTQIAVLPSAHYLKLIDEKGSVRQLFRLEGEAWVGGRDVTCSIYIDNPRVSRKQFEIYREGQRFFIRDIGSANGTMVNGHQISTTEWTELHSADVILVINWTLQFEIHDSNYKQRVDEIEPSKLSKSHVFESQESAPTEDDEFLPTNYSPIPEPQSDQNQYDQNHNVYFPVPGYTQPPPHMPPPAALNQGWVENIKSKLNPVRVVIILILLGAFIYGLMPTDDGGKDSQRTSKNKAPFDSLSAEDQQYVIQCYTAADQFIRQQLYQNALDEILKLETKVKYYQDSKAIKEVAQSALATIAIQREEEKAQKEKAEMDDKIQKQVEQCEKTLLPESVDMTSLDNCLAPVLTLNPDHELIHSLKKRIEQIIAERELKKTKQKEYQEELKKLNALYRKAESLEKNEKLREAIKIYESILNSKYSDNSDVKNKAGSRIKALKKRIETDFVNYVEKAEVAMKESKYRDAVLFLQKANRLQPENEEIKLKLNFATTELHKMMQVLFQDSILEESVGEVEAAKIKWKKIMEQSIQTEEYYEKARLKLRKYGVL